VKKKQQQQTQQIKTKQFAVVLLILKNKIFFCKNQKKILIKVFSINQ
jgi:hypothetical protein